MSPKRRRNAMEKQQDTNTNGKEGRGALKICYVLFAIYFINVLVGKVNISCGMNLIHLGSVAEFLMLFSAAVFLIVAALKAEAAEK